MATFLALLQSWGYIGMFIAAFLAGSFIPFSSEAVLLGLLLADLDPVWLFVNATLGNVGGSMFNYWIGTFGKMEWIERYLHVQREKVERTQRWMERYGAWIGLVTFLPIFGSVVAITLGFTRANPWQSTLAILIGKAARYALLIFAVTQYKYVL